MLERPLLSAIESVPPGRWAVAVSGGADSVALLALLRRRADLSLHVVHLDHQLRGAASSADAQFVAGLARQWMLPCTVAKRADVEPALSALPANPSARYRRLRFALFARVAREHALDGVILAHHADDQAETIFHRLLRGSGPMGLAGMTPRRKLNGLLVLRPLLHVRRRLLVRYLRSIDQPWRTDQSNLSPAYLRNRVRVVLGGRPALVQAILELGIGCGAVRAWVRAQAPALAERFASAALADLPVMLARESARRWLEARGAPPAELVPPVLDRLVEMARDAASAPRQDFPGRVRVRRRAGVIAAE